MPQDSQGLEEREVFRGTRWDKWLYRGIGPLLSLLLAAGLVNPGSGGNGLRVFLAVLIVLALASTLHCPAVQRGQALNSVRRRALHARRRRPNGRRTERGH